jgi:hypothetical protein
MVDAVRQGASLRATARRFHASLLTVQRWVDRAEGQDLDRVDWSNRPAGPHHVANRVCREIEDLVLQTRHDLRERSVLGEYGADAIHATLATRIGHVPSVRTIHRILERRGALDGRRRVRRPPPRRGWYLPDVADGRAEMDLFDIVSGLLIEKGPEVEVLNAISLHGGLVASWVETSMSTLIVRGALVEHWRCFGLPKYAQFDNDTRFQGAHQHRDVISSVMRLCLGLDIVPVFVPPRETGFQAAIESLNARWQAKVWERFHYPSLSALCDQSGKYAAACRQRSVVRAEAAPERRPFPETWSLNLQAMPHGRMVFLRRTDVHGNVYFLGRTFMVDATWQHRLVRCDVALDEGAIRFYALRRRAPDDQPLFKQVHYVLPERPFRE